MTIGYIGFTSLAKPIVKNLIKSGVNVVVYDENPKAVAEIVESVGTRKVEAHGLCIAAYTLIDFMKQNPPPRTMVLQVTDSSAIDPLIDKLLAGGIAQGDIFVDIGLSDTATTVKRYKEMKAIGCGLIDCGIFYDKTHGVIRLAIGGDENGVTQLSWLWDGITGKGGWKYTGPSGSGHYAAYGTQK